MAILGGYWGNGSSAGVRALNLNNSPGNSNTNIGFRLVNCAKIARYVLSTAKTSVLRAHHALIPTATVKHQNRWQRLVDDECRSQHRRRRIEVAHTYRNLYGSIISFDNLYRSYLDARKAKRYRAEVLQYTRHLESNLINLSKRLRNSAWQPGEYRIRRIYEPKARDIRIAPFEDRIVHHALCNVIGPIFEKTFIFDSYACRVGKGSHAAVRRLKSFLRKQGTEYCLSADISKFFDSINHHTILAELEWRLGDVNVLNLARLILSSYESDLELAGTRDPKGIPIGNLTSQWFANIVGNRIDAHAKYDMHLKHYLRYMDNFIVLHQDKGYLAETKLEFESLLRELLYLALNPKTSIFPVRNGVPFLGYKVYSDHVLARGENIRRGTKRLHRQMKMVAQGRMSSAQIQDSLQAWFAYLKQADTYRLRTRIAQEIPGGRYDHLI